MKDKCFEIGAIQAFLDGETTPDMSLRLADHIEVCERCSQVMAAAEEESSFVFSALERELNTLVPTQRLWSRINDSIAEEKSRAPFWQKIYSFVCISIANPSLTAAAGVVLVLGIFAIVSLRTDEPMIVQGPIVDVVPGNASPQNSGNSTTAEINVTEGDLGIPAPAAVKPTVEFTRHSPKELQAIAASARVKPERITAQNAVLITNDGYLPGEESYVQTISDLKQTVDSQKDAVMSPSTRVSYERDMAVVNDSIKRMREVVIKNPRNQAARQVLYSSYQDKIDLLNSVAQREELLAGLR